MIEVREHEVFTKWMSKLSDQRAKAKIIVRLQRVEEGNFGDHKAVGDTVSELRIPYGPGYRIYYTMVGSEIVLLLIGGDKDSQARDIAKAKKLAKEIG